LLYAEVDLNRFNGENWREFRLAFPVNMQQAKVAYEVPMGVMEVGKDEIKGAAGYSKATQIYNTPCKDVHPREVQDWFAASDGKTSLTISSDVAVFDWIDPTDNPANYVILQPVLLASRKSCHGLGNYYIQPGNHSYRFSIYTHSGDWRDNGYRQGTQSRQTLKTVVTDTRKQHGFLPEQQSFGTLSGKGAVVSTIKKCEDDDSVILRYYNIEGNDAEITFHLFKDIQSLNHTNMIEEEPAPAKFSGNGFSYKLGHHAIETFKIGTK
jgi:alpha-mannosidase